MDNIDRAQQELEAYATLVKPPDANKKEAKPTGFCLYCGERIPKGQRWCDAECHADWEAEQRVRRRQYKR